MKPLKCWKLWLVLLAAVVIFFAAATASSKEDIGLFLPSVLPYARDVFIGYIAWKGLEQFRHSVESRKEHDRRLRVATLHARRLTVIGGTYSRIAIVEDRADRARGTRAQSDMQPWMDAVNELRLYTRRHRIWFDPRVRARMEDVWRAFRSAGFAHSDEQDPSRRARGSEMEDEEITALITGYDKAVREQVDPAKEALDEEMQRILHSEDEPLEMPPSQTTK